MILSPNNFVEHIAKAQKLLNTMQIALQGVLRAKDSYENSIIVHIQFKDKFLLNQFNLPPQNSGLNPRLVSLILYSANYFDLVLQREPFVVTGLIRTQSEQDKIYGNLVSYQKAPWKSVHQFGRGCDVRIRNIQTALINKFVEHINRNFPYDENRSTALIERDHIHMQVKG